MGSAGGGGDGGGAVIGLGNERDIVDYVLRPHRSLRSSASASGSMDGAGSGGYKSTASEI